MPRVRRAGQHPVQVTQPVPGVVAVPGNAARGRLPVDDEDLAGAEPAQLDRRGQPGGPRPDDEHVDFHAGPPGDPAGSALALASGRSGAAANRPDTVAAQ